MVPYIFVITWIKRQLDVLCFKILKIPFTLLRSTCFGHQFVHHQELLSCTCSLWSPVLMLPVCWGGEYSPPQHTGNINTGDQRLHVQLRSSWWWTNWCPKHVERNNVNGILRILKQSTSSWRFIQVITKMYGTMNLKFNFLQLLFRITTFIKHC